MRVIGFYWTLPVPWAGFTKLPKSVDEAAKASRSIRYQRARVRQWLKLDGGQLIEEAAFMEVKADRGTAAILPEIDRLLSRAEALDATLALVNFAESFFWRPHAALWGRLQSEPRVMALDPAPVVIDGHAFDPTEHFRAWADLNATHSALKPQAKVEIAAQIAKLREGGARYDEIAKTLNAEGITTPNGKAWTGDNLRKLMTDF